METAQPTKRLKVAGTEGDITMDDDTYETWRKTFNQSIQQELKTIKAKGATSVLLEEEFQHIVNYLLEVQKSGSNDINSENGSDLSTAEEANLEPNINPSHEKDLSNAVKTKRHRWRKDYKLDGSDLKYNNRDNDKTVSHSGRQFSDLQEIYCPERKHVHRKNSRDNITKVKDKFGRSITLSSISLFHKSCPICIEDKKEKDAVKKEQVDEVERLKQKLDDVQSKLDKAEQQHADELNVLKEKLERKEKELEDHRAQGTSTLCENTMDCLGGEDEFQSAGSTDFDCDTPIYYHHDTNTQPSLEPLESGKPLVLFSKILERTEAKDARKAARLRMSNTISSQFWASLRSVLYTVGISDIIKMINHRYDFSNLIKKEVVTGTQESDHILQVLKKIVAKVQVKEPTMSNTLDAISWYYVDLVKHQEKAKQEKFVYEKEKFDYVIELLDVFGELVQFIDEDKFETLKQEYGQAFYIDNISQLSSELLETKDFTKLRSGETEKLVQLPAFMYVLSKYFIDYLEEYIRHHDALVTVLKSMESGEDIKITKTLIEAARKTVKKNTEKGVVANNVLLCFEWLLKWLSLENLFLVTTSSTSYSHLKVSTNNKSETYKMERLLDKYEIVQHGAYLVIIREGENDTRIDDVLSLCLQKQNKIYIVLRSFIRYDEKGNQYDAYVTSKNERNKWTLLDDTNVYADAKEALALSSYANCFFYEILSEADYYKLANSEESSIKKLATLSNEAKLVASVVSVGLHCNGHHNVEEEMFELVEKFYLRPNCYPQLFTKEGKLSATGNLYLKEALRIKQYSVQNECSLVMQGYLEGYVPLYLFANLNDKNSVVKAFKQHILNQITRDLRIYEAPIKSDQLCQQLADWTIARGKTST